jgi:hypothetical protein
MPPPGVGASVAKLDLTEQSMGLQRRRVAWEESSKIKGRIADGVRSGRELASNDQASFV